ncbi:Acid sphingomyelinase-like phosphodiesterase 3b [Sorochytrium milnesiophthora]
MLPSSRSKGGRRQGRQATTTTTFLIAAAAAATTLAAALPGPLLHSQQQTPFLAARPAAAAREGDDLLSVLHITDVHYDPYYRPYTTTVNFCHRHRVWIDPSTGGDSDDGTVDARRRKNKNDNVAGEYGALGSACDSPPSLVHLVTDFVAALAQGSGSHPVPPQSALLTGDTARHNRDDMVPRQEREVYEAQRKVVHGLWTALGGDNSTVTTPVLTNLGNLDVNPHNMLGARSPVLQGLADAIAPYVDARVASEFGTHGSYVSPLHRSVVVVSLNTMYMYKENTAAGDCDDARGPARRTLVWFEDALRAARANQQKAVVMGHVPPAYPPDTPLYKPTCYRQFVDMLGEYSDVVLSMHSGHLNFDSTSFVYRRRPRRRDDASDNSGDDNADDDGDNGDVEAGPTYDILTVSDVIKQAERTTEGDDNLKGSKPKRGQVSADKVELLVPLYMAPSVIPANNPGVRVMQLNLTSLTWAGWQQYYLPLSEHSAHKPYTPVQRLEEDGGDDDVDVDKKKKKKKKHHPDEPPPRFQLEYDTRSAYEMADLGLDSWHTMLKRAARNDRGAGRHMTVGEMYEQFKTVQGPVALKK